jgi:hypothetical protein
MFQLVNISRSIKIAIVGVTAWALVMGGTAYGASMVNLTNAPGAPWLGEGITNLLPGQSVTRGINITDGGSYPLSVLTLDPVVSVSPLADVVEAQVTTCSGGVIGTYDPISTMPSTITLSPTGSPQTACIQVAYSLPSTAGNAAADGTLNVAYSVGYTYQPPGASSASSGTVPVVSTPAPTPTPASHTVSSPNSHTNTSSGKTRHIGRSVLAPSAHTFLDRTISTITHVIRAVFTTPAGLASSGGVLGLGGLGFGLILFRRHKGKNMEDEYVPLRQG